jgi:3'-5' exoribonuclease
MKYPNKINDLKYLAESFGQETLELSNVILDDQLFRTWSGSSRETLHHYGAGGLQYHTWEVVNLCLVNTIVFPTHEINKQVLFFAALFHDIGKTFDYTYNLSEDKWESTPHKYRIHHISRSGLIWMENVKGTVFEPIRDQVYHAILAHHGRKEWGSPVEPRSREAWLLHLCDGISARMDDCDKLHEKR